MPARPDREDAVPPTPRRTYAELEAEVTRLRQGLWECAREAGADLDGDPTPAHLTYPDVVDFAVEAVRELRENYEEALDDVPMGPGVGEALGRSLAVSDPVFSPRTLERVRHMLGQLRDR